MAFLQPIRVRVAAPPAEARKLCARLSRGGIAAAPDDGTSRAEVLVAFEPSQLADLRERTERLVVVGRPAAVWFAVGADDVVTPGEPEVLFRRLRSEIERLDFMGRLDRQADRIAALEAALADAAHDVRSPLQAVIGNAELLSRDATLTDGQRQSAQAAARQAMRALQLAERILEGSRKTDRAALEALPLDVGELIEASVTQARPQARLRGVELVGAPPQQPIELHGDEQLLGRLLDNLVANAVHASPRGSAVEVSGWRASPKTVRLAVKDQGDGIPAAELPRLVAGFGPGRGLRICRDIAERHSGELWAESAPGKGARFLVELPLQPPATRPRVLLVSDDARWLREVASTLKEACVVRSSSFSGARIGTRRTDLVLVEAQRGRQKALDALRSAAHGAQVPLIELPSEVAATRLARTLAHLAP